MYQFYIYCIKIGRHIKHLPAVSILLCNPNIEETNKTIENCSGRPTVTWTVVPAGPAKNNLTMCLTTWQWQCIYNFTIIAVSPRQVYYQCKAFEWSTAAVDRPSQPVKLVVYYESLCPDSFRFFKEQLWPTWQKLSGIINLSLIPFGNAYVSKILYILCKQ